MTKIDVSPCRRRRSRGNHHRRPGLRGPRPVGLLRLHHPDADAPADLRRSAAVRTIYRILKPGGVLLATFPGITQTYDLEWGASWYWNFTNVSARRLSERFSQPANVTVETFGNVLTAMSFLHGVAAEELTSEELDYRDPAYDVTITVRAGSPRPTPMRDRETGESVGANFGDRATRAGGRAPAEAAQRRRRHDPDVSPDRGRARRTPGPYASPRKISRSNSRSCVSGPLPLQLRELVEPRSAMAPRRPVRWSLTFDDGYADNLYQAKPLLSRHQTCRRRSS